MSFFWFILGKKRKQLCKQIVQCAKVWPLLSGYLWIFVFYLQNFLRNLKNLAIKFKLGSSCLQPVLAVEVCLRQEKTKINKPKTSFLVTIFSVLLLTNLLTSISAQALSQTPRKDASTVSTSALTSSFLVQATFDHLVASFANTENCFDLSRSILLINCLLKNKLEGQNFTLLSQSAAKNSKNNNNNNSTPKENSNSTNSKSNSESNNSESEDRGQNNNSQNVKTTKTSGVGRSDCKKMRVEIDITNIAKPGKFLPIIPRDCALEQQTIGGKTVWAAKPLSLAIIPDVLIRGFSLIASIIFYLFFFMLVLAGVQIIWDAIGGQQKARAIKNLQDNTVALILVVAAYGIILAIINFLKFDTANTDVKSFFN